MEDPSQEILTVLKHIESLEERYGSFSSFEGFYIPYELYVFKDGKADLVRTLFSTISRHCKEVAPQKEVMISPFFILDQKGHLGDFDWAEPEEYTAFWMDVLSQSSIDILALQDSGEHLSFFTMDQRKPFFAAVKKACDATSTQFWANIETAELQVESYDDYVSRFGLKTHVNDPRTQSSWKAVSSQKLAQKLAMVRPYTDTAITWGYREFIRPSLGTSAEKTYTEYRQLLLGHKAPE